MSAANKFAPMQRLIAQTIGTPATNVEVKPLIGPWTKRIEKTKIDLEAVCTDAQMSILETIAVEALDFGQVADGFKAAMRAHVAALHPSGKVSATMYFPIIASLRVNFGPYAATGYREAVKALLKGKLPTKSDKRSKGGTKGQTPSKWYLGVHRRVAELTERIGKAPTGNINAKALRGFVDAYKALVMADKALKRAISE